MKREEIERLDKIMWKVFDWSEKYYPTKRYYEEGNKQNIEKGSENCPYDYWKRTFISKIVEILYDESYRNVNELKNWLKKAKSTKACNECFNIHSVPYCNGRKQMIIDVLDHLEGK